MNQANYPRNHRPSFWKNPGYWLYHQWAEVYSFFMENFNPKWREPLPLIPCQICGETNHKTKTCPNAEKMGF